MSVEAIRMIAMGVILVAVLAILLYKPNEKKSDSNKTDKEIK